MFNGANVERVFITIIIIIIIMLSMVLGLKIVFYSHPHVLIRNMHKGGEKDQASVIPLRHLD